MIDPSDSLHIPEAYGQWLGGLRWSTGGEAVEWPDGSTFAFGRELATLIDGFIAGRGPIHFAHMVHLAHLLLKGPLGSVPAPMDLAGGFALLGRPHRNAGALCAVLCEEIPGLPDPPDMEAVCRMLTAGAVGAEYQAAGVVNADLVTWGGLWPEPMRDEPPLEPAEFERKVLERLGAMAPDEVRHWLRTGRGPERGGTVVARQVTIGLPRTCREAMEPLLRRPRLAASAALLDRLVGALALPPRRLARGSLPTGGYADVSTRGHPEQLLPSQHAMEPEEFVRRFTSNELLYFQREEPHTPESEEFVVLLDQGVRTWGVVRPVLATAAVALGRLADRKGVRLRLATSGDPRRLVEPALADPETLVKLLEASDLSPHPAALLAGGLAGGSGKRRDVILLTHPRSLAEPEVDEAAREAAEGDRVFAVAVNEHREVVLSELRRGHPVTLSRFRAELPGAVRPRIERPSATSSGDWEGDVEPIGFPFRMRPQGEPGPRGTGATFALDEAGDWLMAIGPRGVPYAWRVDGRPDGPWPRGFSGGEVVRRVDAVLGVAGGFVAIGRLGEGHRPVAVHYDLLSRRVRVFVKYLSPGPAWDWFYLRDSHALVARGAMESWYLDLRTGGRFSSQDRCSSEAVAADLRRVGGAGPASALAPYPAR